MFCRAKKKLPLYTLANERLKELFLNKHFTVLSPTASTQLFKYLVSQSIRWELFLGTAKHPFVTNCLGMVRSPQNCRSISGRHNRLTSFLSSSVLIFMLHIAFSRNINVIHMGGFHLHLLVFPFVYQFNSRIGVLGWKYLVFESSRSVKMRGFSFLSLHAFWGKCVYFSIFE